jgi:hypothetical protein
MGKDKIRDIAALMLFVVLIIGGYNTLGLLKSIEKLQREIIKRDSVNRVNIEINRKLNEELKIRKELFN